MEQADLRQVVQLNYLISPELLGAARAHSYSRRFKLQLLSVLIVFPLLISTVGPASAACMIPRYAPWYSFTGIYGFTKTRDEFFPRILDLSSPAASSWNTTGMDSFVQFSPIFRHSTPTMNQNTSFSWPVNNVTSPMTLYVQTQGPFNDTENAVYNATTSIQNIAISSMFFSLDPWTIEGSMDAFSNVSCPAANKVIWNASNESLPIPSLTFNTPTIGTVTGNLDEFDAFNIRSSLGTLYPNTGDVIAETARFIDLPGTKAVGIVYFTADTDLDSNVNLTLHPCTATLGWLATDLRFTGQALASRSPPDLQKTKDRIRSTAISITSVREMPLLPTSTHSDSLRLILNSWMIPSVAPLALSVMLTTVLSTASGTVSSSDSAICNTRTGYCGDYHATTLKMLNFRLGYGYGTEINSVRISLAILMLYCLIAAIHTGVTIYTGKTSTAWDSVSEFVALAMGSRRPAELNNTSAGIDSARVFEHKVRIAATAGKESAGTVGRSGSTGEHLELIFPSTEGAVLSKVRANAEYDDSGT